MLTIELLGLKEGINPLEVSFSGDIPLFRELDADLAGEGVLVGTIDKRENEFYLLSGTISILVRLSCRRCLDLFEEEIRANITLVLMLKESRNPGDIEEEDILYITAGQRSLDLDEVVREHFLLNLPTHPLCSEGCQGLCPGCGVDLNKENCSCVE